MKINVKTVRRLMAEHLFTQQGLADAAGVTRATINGTLLKGSCSAPTVGKIAQAFGVKPIEIIEQEDE